MAFIYFDLLAVIANQYIKPGVKPTINGIHTGHPSIALAMIFKPKLILFKSIQKSDFQK